MNKIILKPLSGAKLNVIAQKALHAKKPLAQAKPAKKKPRTRNEICMNLTGGHINAARLLSTIWGITETRERKGTLTLERFGKKWVAMPRDEWATLAQLKAGPMKNSALPALREACSSFVEIRTMKVSPTSTNELWISIDIPAMQNALIPWDMVELENAGGPLWPKKKNYPYKKNA